MPASSEVRGEVGDIAHVKREPRTVRRRVTDKSPLTTEQAPLLATHL